MSGQDPRRSSSLLVNDRRFSIDDDIVEEEINLEEINPKRQSSSSQRRVTSNEDNANTDANRDADAENDVNIEDVPLSYEDIDDDTVSEEGDDAYFFETDPEPPLCGWCCFRPGCLQCCRTLHWALLALCIAGIIQGMVINGFYTLDITTIERRFGLRSRFTGIIAGVYDLAAIFAIFPLTLWGGLPKSSKPRWFGCGMLLMGIGSLIFTIPHFIAPPYEVNGNTSSLCFDEHEQADEIVYEDVSYLGWIFLLGQILHGLGTSPLYTQGVIYIDENVRTLNSTLYIGVFYSMNVVGTAMGYILGGLFLRIFTNLSVDPGEFGLTVDSSAWIGAWWIGYFLSAGMCFVVGVWLLAFPPYLPTTLALKEENKRFAEVRSVDDYLGEEYDEDEEDEDEDEEDDKVKRATLTKSLLLMCNNPTLLFINLAVGSGNIVNSGFIAFLPKIIENQFSINPSQASLMLGLAAIPLGGGATFLGGYLVRRLQLLCPGTLKFCIITTFLGLLFTSAFLFTCPNQNFAGVTENGDSTNLTLNQACNEKCECSPNLYQPICGVDKTIYYSPCYAGCVTELSCEKEKYFTDCKCIGDIEEECSEDEGDFEDDSKREKRKAKEVPEHDAVAGKCEPDCGNFVPFTILIVLVLFCTFLLEIPSLSASLRCVREDQKAAALGSHWFCIRVLGSIPSPIIFGHIIDMTCLLWRDQTGSCLVFDNSGLSFYLMLLTVAGKVLSMIFYFIAWICFVSTAKKEEDQESLLSNESQGDKYGT